MFPNNTFGIIFAQSACVWFVIVFFKVDSFESSHCSFVDLYLKLMFQICSKMIIKFTPVSFTTAILIAVLLYKFQLTEASLQNNYTDCIRKLKGQGEYINDRFTDAQLAAICRQQEEWELEKEKPVDPQKPKTPDQSNFLNKLACKTIEECLGSPN